MEKHTLMLAKRNAKKQLLKICLQYLRERKEKEKKRYLFTVYKTAICYFSILIAPNKPAIISTFKFLQLIT